MKKYIVASQEVDYDITIHANGETVTINPYYTEMVWEGHDKGGQYGSWTDLLLDLKGILMDHTKH